MWGIITMELSERGQKASNSYLNKSGMLYVFEDVNGVRHLFDGLRQFARSIDVDVNNLYRTYTHKTNSRKGCKGWKLIDCISIVDPDWNDVVERIKSCKIIDRIKTKLMNVKKKLVSVRLYGMKLWKKAKNTFNEYVEEKMQEASNEPMWSFNRKFMSESDYDDLCQKNLRDSELLIC
jgi:hypothetical protein